MLGISEQRLHIGHLDDLAGIHHRDVIGHFSNDAEIVGEADEATPALEGMELDDDSLRRAQMLEQLNEMASREPAELSGILRRWMRSNA